VSDNIWKRTEIESPCVKICAIHPIHKVCVGCFRTTSEIAGWSNFTSEERRNIMTRLKERKKLTQPKRQGGRSGRVKN